MACYLPCDSPKVRKSQGRVLGGIMNGEGVTLMRSLGPMEIVAILAVAVLLFGGKRIPEVAKGLGEGIRNFKNAMKAEDAKPEEKTKQA